MISYEFVYNVVHSSMF